MMQLPPLNDEAIILGAVAPDWRAAVRIAGSALTAVGAATPAYSIEMIRMIERHGPYVVIAPGLALAHARPGPAVTGDGLAVVTLADPVAFGHPHNDPVRVVLGLAVTNAVDHVTYVAAVANVFNDSGAVDALTKATSTAEVRHILGFS